MEGRTFNNYFKDPFIWLEITHKKKRKRKTKNNRKYNVDRRLLRQRKTRTKKCLFCRNMLSASVNVD